MKPLERNHRNHWRTVSISHRSYHNPEISSNGISKKAKEAMFYRVLERRTQEISMLDPRLVWPFLEDIWSLIGFSLPKHSSSSSSNSNNNSTMIQPSIAARAVREFLLSKYQTMIDEEISPAQRKFAWRIVRDVFRHIEDRKCDMLKTSTTTSSIWEIPLAQEKDANKETTLRGIEIVTIQAPDTTNCKELNALSSIAATVKSLSDNDSDSRDKDNKLLEDVERKNCVSEKDSNLDDYGTSARKTKINNGGSNQKSDENDNAYQVNWNEMFRRLVVHQEQHHESTQVTEASSLEHRQLQDWVIRQRQSYRIGRLSKPRIRLLESIGLQWQLSQPTSSKTNHNEWHKMYEWLVSYQHWHHGQTNVPESHPKLGPWVQRQRTQYHRKSLAEDKIALLESIGFEWKLPVVSTPGFE